MTVLPVGRTRVVAPDGVEWSVGRRWTQRRTRWPRRPRDLSADWLSGLGVPDSPGVDSAEGLLLVVGVTILLLLLVPILFFGFELVVLGALLSAGVVGRVVLRQPWVIDATATTPFRSERRLEWQVRGWRKSRTVINAVVADLSAGREPDPHLTDRHALPERSRR